MQGVFFRASTREVAMSLGLTGHALNLPDGTVEILACGDGEAVVTLEAWLAEGPRMADVAGIRATDADCDPPRDFTTG